MPPHMLPRLSEALYPTMQDLLNLSLATACVPEAWKHAIVKPLLKKPSLDATVLENCRPISLLPFAGKVLERHVNIQLSEFLETNNLLHPSQTCFRPQHSTESALLAVTEMLRARLYKEGSVAVILLDLSAALDTVFHKVLMERLGSMGIGGEA